MKNQARLALRRKVAFGSQPLLSIVLEYCVLTVMAWCFVIFLTRRKKESVMSSGEKNILED